MLPSLTRIVTRLSLVALVVTFAGCSQKDLLERISSPEDRALGGQVIADLQEGASGDADLTQRLQPDLRAKLGRVLPRMSAIVPAGPSRLVDAKYTEFAVLGGRKTRESYLAYEVDGANRAHALVRISIERQDGAPQIVALYVNSMAAKAEDLFGFSLIGKSPWQYLILAFAVLSLSTIVLAEIVLFRTKGVRRKWLWAIGCLFGIGQVSVNWSTGDLGFALLRFRVVRQGPLLALSRRHRRHDGFAAGCDARLHALAPITGADLRA